MGWHLCPSHDRTIIHIRLAYLGMWSLTILSWITLAWMVLNASGLQTKSSTLWMIEASTWARSFSMSQSEMIMPELCRSSRWICQSKRQLSSFITWDDMNEQFFLHRCPLVETTPVEHWLGSAKEKDQKKTVEPGCGRGHAQWCSPNPQLCDQHWPTGFQTVLVCSAAMWGSFARPIDWKQTRAGPVLW